MCSTAGGLKQETQPLRQAIVTEIPISHKRRLESFHGQHHDSKTMSEDSPGFPKIRLTQSIDLRLSRGAMESPEKALRDY